MDVWNANRQQHQILKIIPRYGGEGTRGARNLPLPLSSAGVLEKNKEFVKVKLSLCLTN
jgi:hypothetical protein